MPKPTAYIEIYLAVATILAIMLTMYDKRAARHGSWRVEERTLLPVSVFGGLAAVFEALRMYNLLKAIPLHMTVILVGDVDQLPSVGAGNVLQDIIDSGIVPVVKLDKIFRQAQGSDIIRNAHRNNK